MIAVIDCGSQTTQLIARRIRELGLFSRVFPASTKAHDLSEAKAIIISGGPDSLLAVQAIRLDPQIFNLSVPMLGICYGMQLIVDYYGGQLERGSTGEYGQRLIEHTHNSKLFLGLRNSLDIWMSHTDQTKTMPSGFITIAYTKTCPHAAIEHREKKIFGLQFHPELSHSEAGTEILANFLFKIASLKPDYKLGDVLSQKISAIKNQVGSAQVLMALSGGVDSSVAAVLIHRALGSQLRCVYVNHGLNRHDEMTELNQVFFNLGLELNIIDAREQFLAGLHGLSDPEAKRKAIGHMFISIFEQEARAYRDVKFLGQGTLYPDVIESQGIKSHHNVGGLPKDMKLELLEPLRDLFKDEAKQIGRLLGLSDRIVMRQPFPGPGLAVRIPGEVSFERLELLRKADQIVCEEINHQKSQLAPDLWQYFAILLPVKSVGIMGDARVYGETIVIRSVDSTDGMTADWSKLPHDLLGRMSNRICNEVPGISRVLYDISQKPPGTIEWE